MYTKAHFEKLLSLAKEEKMQLRVFYNKFGDPEYFGGRTPGGQGPGNWAVEGIPILYEDHMIFPAGSWEVLETGNVGNCSGKAQRRAGLQLLPYSQVTLLELSPKHPSDQ